MNNASPSDPDSDPPRRPRAVWWGVSAALLLGSLLISYLTGVLVLIVFVPLVFLPLLWSRNR